MQAKTIHSGKPKIMVPELAVYALKPPKAVRQCQQGEAHRQNGSAQTVHRAIGSIRAFGGEEVHDDVCRAWLGTKA